MNKLLGLVRRCAEDYRMISPGDRICVGVSGGKDSLTLLVLLAKLRDFYPAPFELCAVTIDMGLGMDFTPVAGLCRELDIPYECVRTEIGPIIFDYRKEKNPCSMCAKMRRGGAERTAEKDGLRQGGPGSPSRRRRGDLPHEPAV